MNRLLSSHRTRGFTIIELLIVITVIGILIALSVASYNGIQQNARGKSVISDADGVEAEIARYSAKNNGALGSAVAWYSGGSANSNIKFTPSSGNVIDVVANTTDYCIRVYNVAAQQYISIATAFTKGLTTTSCAGLSASSAAVSGSP